MTIQVAPHGKSYLKNGVHRIDDGTLRTIVLQSKIGVQLKVH